MTRTGAIKNGFFSLVTLIAASFLAFGLSDNSYADHGGSSHADVGLTAPGTNTTGNYTVSWDPQGTVYLQEKKDGGAYSTVYYGTGTSKAFSAKGAGTYTYRILVEICFFYPDCFYLYSEPVTTVVSVPVPSTPGAISGPGSASYSTTGGASYSLSWGASTGTVTGYQLEEKINSGSWTTVQNTTSNSKSFSGKYAATYYYRVRACNGGSCSAYTATKTVSVTANYALSSSTSSTSTGNFTLSWSNPSAHDEFHIEQQLNGGSWGVVAITGATSYSFSNRPDGNYNFRVQYCINYFQVCTATSNTVSVVVAKPPGTPASIGGVPATNNNGAFTVSWGTASGTVSSYQLEQQTNGGSWAQIYSGAGTSKAVSGLADGTYGYRVRACNSVGCSGYRTSSNAIIANVPPTPASISGVPATDSDGTFTVSWPTATNADNYRLEQQTNGGAWTQIYSSTGTSKAVSGLADGTYSYRVRACNTYSTYTTCSGYRTSGAVVVANAPPTPASISGVPATDSDGAFTVSWPTATNADNYRLEQQTNGGAWTQIYSSTGTSKAVSGLADGTYSYRVRACNTYSTYTSCSGYRTSGSVLVENTPGAPGAISGPGSLSYSVPGGVSYSLSWTASSGNVTAYELQEQINSGSWSTIQTSAALTKSFSGKYQGTYKYRVRACNGGSCTSYGAEKTVTVSASYTLTASPASSSNGNTTLSWTNPDSHTVFNIEKLSGSTWNPVAQTSSTSYGITNQPDGTHSYRVQYCVDFPGSGTVCTATSNTAQFVVLLPPGMPASITTPPNSGNGSFSLSWGTASGTVSSYKLERENNGSGTWTEVYSGTATATTVNGLADGSYKFRIKACNASGCSSPRTNNAALVANTPGVPGNIAGASGTISQSIALSWAAASGNVDNYTLQQRLNSGTWTTIQDTGALSKTASVTTDGTYDFKVRACNTYSTFTSCSNYTTNKTVTALYVGMPGSISGPSIDPLGTYLLSWSAAAGTVTSYTLQERKNAGSWSTIYSGGNTQFGPQNQVDATYDYRVNACNAQGCSSYTSNKTVVVNSTTTPPLVPPAPFNPDPAVLVSASEVTATDNASVSGGSFRVDESGSATYNIPIMTVAGTAGVVPEISLHYSSNGGNGVAGLGWNLSGLSAISRCRQTLYQDGAAQPISFSAADRFCLDGQRLILLAGTYGAANSVYKTEIDSFARVTALGGTTGHPDYWTVERKDGSTATYGSTGTGQASELEGWTNANVSTTPATGTKSGKVASWGVREIKDSVGNIILFDYANDAAGFRIDSVRYAFGGTTSSDNARVRFEYADREDRSLSYMAGYAIPSAKRLSKIISENKVSGAWTEVRSYQLNYHATLSVNKLSRLDNVEECIASTCLPNSTSFTWSLPVAGESYSTSDTSFTMQNLVTYQLADFNGDGRTDIVWAKHQSSGGDQGLQVAYGNNAGTGLITQTIVNYAGTATSSVLYHDNPINEQALKLFPFDFNADGRSDLAVYSYLAEYGHTVGWHLYLSEYDQAAGDWKLKFQGDLPIKDEYAIFADLDSDGLVDAISEGKVYYLEHDGSQNVSSNKYYHYPNIAQYDLDIGALPPDVSSPPYYENYSFGGFKTAGADFNGDGQADGIAMILKEFPDLFDPNGSPQWGASASVRINVGIVNGKQTFIEMAAPLDATTSLPFNAKDFFNMVSTPDINGDGLSDLVYYKDDNFHYALSDGVQLNYVGTIVNAGNLSDAKKRDFSLADINRDGYPDAVWHDWSTSTIRTRKWNPTSQSFDTAVTLRGGVGSNKDHSHVYFDYNADTITDYVTFQGSKFEVYEGNNADQPINRIISIANGLGALTSISYETLGHSEHYTHLDATYTDTTQATCTVDLSQWQGGGVIEYSCPQTTIDLNGFYTALNGDWVLPAGNDSLGKQSHPVLELNGPMYVVTQVESSAPEAHATNAGQVDDNATSAISYHYGEAKIQAMGRGMLGFKTLTTIDQQTGVRTLTTYRQDFPFIGQPLSTKVYSVQGQLLSESNNVTKLIGWNGTGTPATSYYQPYTYQSIDQTYQLVDDGATAGAVLQTATTSSSYDTDGNATNITVTTAGGGKNFEKEVINTYAATGFTSAESKRLGRLSHTQVTTKRDENGDSSYELSDTRNSSFTYITSGALKGLLQTETIEPGTSFEHTITHSYDSFGNKVKAETTAYAGNGSNSQNRYSRSEYDITGRYVQATYEQFSNASGTPVEKKVSEVISRNSYGAATETRTWVDDSTWVTSKAAYTPFGIKYFESNSSGSYSINTLASGTGSQCPTGTVFYSRSQTAGGGESQQCFDKLGRSIRKAAQGFSGTWSYSDTEYDSIGRVKRQSEPYFAGQTSCNSTSNTSKCWASISYDILGRPTSAVAPDGSVSSTAYNGLSTVSTNALNQDKTETKNVLGEMVSVTDNLNGTTSYGYDAQGNLVSMTDAASNTTTLVYDKLGRKTSMSDPDKGNWSYIYNGFGELIEQTDAKGQKSELSYDVRGRLIQRIDRLANGTAETNTSWTYDSAAYGRGQLDSVVDSLSGYIKAPQYDSLGRLSETVTSLGLGGALGDHYEKITYDQYGRTYQVFDAARASADYSTNGTQNHYNSYGYLYQVTSAEQLNGQPASTYHSILAMDARGNITNEQLGNGVTRSAHYEHNTGLLDSLQASLGAATYQNLSLQWDEVGNLEQRKETGNGRNLEENFLYDSLNRLSSSQVIGSSAQTVSYNAIGNITNKSDVGAYSYGAGSAGPHAVTSAGGQTYTYDANGNNISGDGRTLSYTSYDKPSQIIKGNHKVEFEYGPDRSRYRRTDTDSSTGRVTDTLYIGSVEKITNPDGSKEWKRSLGNLIIKQVFNSSGTQTGKSEHYLLKDHLGSPSLILDKIAQVQQTLDFDPWGARRTTNWAAMSSTELTNSFFKNVSVSNSVGTNSLTSRGFTGHEMLDEVGIIHMNGRIYDAKLGRFLQADPMIQDPFDTQSLNRYSYTNNNPLNAVDPSGFSFIKKWLGTILAIAVSIACVGTCTPAVWAAWAGLAGFVGGFVATGSLQGALIGGLTGAAFGYLGGSFLAGDIGLGQFVAMSALTGGITSVLGGGKFGHGFFSAGAGAFVGTKIGGFVRGAGNTLRNLGTFIAKTTLGGVLSAVTGGKFANGAGFAAFSAAVSYAATPGGEKLSSSYTQAEIDNLSDGEWIFPEGGSTNLNDYPEVQTNGILGDRDAFVAHVNESEVPGFFNPSKGIIRDLGQSFAQKFGIGTDTMAQEFALSLGQVDHAMVITAHSQGTLTVANAAYFGLPQGSTFVFKSPALTHFRASMAANRVGATLQYVQPFGDGANLWAPSINPFKFSSGLSDLLCGFCTHRANGL